MWEAEVNHFAEILKRLFPMDADIRRCPPTISFEIDWMLNTDPVRPNKRSRTIVVHLSREFLDDYAEGTQHHKVLEESRVIREISVRLARFNPDHDMPRSKVPPRETWTF